MLYISGTLADSTKPGTFYLSNPGTIEIPQEYRSSMIMVLPINLRKEVSAKTDVFNIWITKKGETGRIDNPAKGLAYGVATVILKYTNEATINNYTSKLGNPLNLVESSLFSTATGSRYLRPDANSSPKIGKTIDFVYNTNSSDSVILGSFYTSSGTTDPFVKRGFADVSNITSYTKMAPVADAATYDNTNTQAELSAAVDAVLFSSSVSNKVVYKGTGTADGKVFAFQTAAGKKGLVKIVSATGNATSSGEISLQVKVER